MGGALTIASAVLCDGLNAAAPFYGIPSKELADPGRSKVPIQAHFAQLDKNKPFSDPDSANQLEKTLKENNVPHEFYRYENSDHGYVNETRESYNEASAKLAEERVKEFFTKHLQI
jgi:carboxymethylenebutenolidase